MNINFGTGTAGPLGSFNPLNTKVKRQKTGLGGLILLLVVGMIFLAAGIGMIRSSSINPSWKRVTGTVTSVSTDTGSSSTTYTPVVSYKVDGQTYQVTSRISSSSYPTIGSTREVAYNPEQPSEAKVVGSAGTKLFAYLVPVIGVLLIVLGVLSFVRSSRRSHDITDLRQAGQKVQGIITDIQGLGMNSGINNNTGTGSYRIVVSAPDGSGGTRDYTSDPLTGIGGLAMADFRSNPIPIDVYLNPANPSDYYVDVSEVPSFTPQRIAELIKSAAQWRSLPGGVQSTPSASSQPQNPNEQSIPSQRPPQTGQPV